MLRFLKNILCFSLIVVNGLYAQVDNEILTIENSLSPGIQFKGEKIQKKSVDQWLADQNIKNVSVAVFLNGKIRWAKGYGIADPETNKKVDSNTLFQAASISKPVAAWGVHFLVQKGLLDLDKNVNDYLRSWKLEENKFTEKQVVSLRHLMTHTAGTTVHGFPGYAASASFPSDIEVLNGEGNTDKIIVDTFPGTINRYSGGGYTIMERVVEDVTEQSFSKFMDETVLSAMGMKNSTYAQPLPEDQLDDACVAFYGTGMPIPGRWHSYPEQAAAGLWTTPSDLARFLIGVQKTYDGKNYLFKKNMAEVFLTRDSLGHGHGPAVFGEGKDKKFGHGGKNAGYTCNMMASVKGGFGLVIMSSSDNARPVIEALERAIAEQYNWDWAKPQVLEKVEISKEGLEKYTGNYFYKPASITVKFYEEENKLKLDSPFGQRIVLEYLGEDLFIDASDGTRIKFTYDDQGKINGLVQNGRATLSKVD